MIQTSSGVFAVVWSGSEKNSGCRHFLFHELHLFYSGTRPTCVA